jgi:hypothetical protein
VDVKKAHRLPGGLLDRLLPRIDALARGEPPEGFDVPNDHWNDVAVVCEGQIDLVLDVERGAGSGGQNGEENVAGADLFLDLAQLCQDASLFMVFVPDIVPLLLQRFDKGVTPGIIGAAVAEKDTGQRFVVFTCFWYE